jgi:hypothetical protein
MEGVKNMRMLLFGEAEFRVCAFCGAATESTDSFVCSLHAAQVGIFPCSFIACLSIHHEQKLT